MNLKCLLVLFALCLVFHNTPTADSSRILAAFPFPGPSHFMMTNAIIKELISNGHEVTMITGISLKHLKLGSNYTEILIEPAYDFWSDLQEIFATDNIFALADMNLFDFIKMLKIMGLRTSEHALMQSKVQAIINAEKTENVYDLLLAEQFYQEAFLALAYKYNIPIVTTSTRSYETFYSQMVGIVSPWSFVPHGSLPFTDHMTFWQRVKNSFYALYDDVQRELDYFPSMDKLVQKYFSHLPVQIPKVSEMARNISLMLVNSYIPLVTVRPASDALIPVGGIHIYPNKSLPADLQEFLDGAENGAIFFSLDKFHKFHHASIPYVGFEEGSNVQAKDMPVEKLQIFLEVFGSLKQRVIWKYEDDNLKNVPKNVMIKKWLPQQDILAHPKLKVFITHGGLFSTQEGVHYGVPMLGIPFYCDQLLNMNKAVRGGFALSLHFPAIDKNNLHHTILELIEDPKYKDNVQHASEIFRERPMSPRESAIYWIEYVLKHKGAKHLRSAGLDLKWYQFYLLDILVFFSVAIVVLIMAFKLILHLLCKKSERKTHKKQKQL